MWIGEELGDVRAILFKVEEKLRAVREAQAAALAARLLALSPAWQSADVPPLPDLPVRAGDQAGPSVQTEPIDLESEESTTETIVGVSSEIFVVRDSGPPVSTTGEAEAEGAFPRSRSSRSRSPAQSSAGGRWKPAETSKLFELRLQRVTFREIGRQLGKSEQQCKEKFKYERSMGRAPSS